MSINGRTLSQGEYLTLDGSRGAVYEGELPLVAPQLPVEYETLMRWCDARRRLKVRTNADTPYDAENAIRLGAEGIGLCRTEHMFFDTQERRLAIQEMILAACVDDRRRALDKLLPYQRQDFIGIFEGMAGRPVTIRLVDPPLHEFVPHTEEKQRRLADDLGVPFERIRDRVEQLHESNPMLGHRGCRLAITYPEILEMQVRAIIEAAVECRRRKVKVIPEIMIPLCIDAKELKILVDQTREVADEVLSAAGMKLKYLVGTMIETPRAALLAGDVAEVAEFFSFGTNDLTQTVMALSRDDAGRFLPEYVDQDKAAVFSADPFQTLDRQGVGMLMEHAIKHGRKSRKALEVGICGEHGGDASSVAFCDEVGMDYVSCSPYRVPIARLAAAQAVISRSPAGRPRKAAAKKKAPARATAARRKKGVSSRKSHARPKARKGPAVRTAVRRKKKSVAKKRRR